MNPYIFSKELNDDLLDFLRTAEQHKNSKFCDLQKYEQWKKIIPPPNIHAEVQGDDVIEIQDSDNEVEEIKSEVSLDLDFPETTVDDIIHAVKENLEMQNFIPESVLNQIMEYPGDKLDNAFRELEKELGIESVINLGESLDKHKYNESVLRSYIQLLLRKLQLEYSDEGHNLFNKFAQKYCNVFTEELSKILIGSQDEDNHVLLQYVNGLNLDAKALTLRLFLFGCINLCDNYITAIDVLLNEKVDYDSLSKLVQLFTIGADDYSADKSFGKLLLNMVQYLGKNILQMEQPLKHIIGKHRSIWKIKIQKNFNKCIEDNMILSQSFR